MIKCPECHQDVSDKAAKCVHCGTDFSQLKQQRCPECGTVLDGDVSVCNSCGCPITSEKVNEKILSKNFFKINEKKIIIGVIAVVCLIMFLGTGAFLVKKKAYNDYIKTLELTKEAMYDGASRSEEMINITAKVWKNAVYEEEENSTDKYVNPSGINFNDFDTAIQLLYDDTITVARISIISSNQKQVGVYMKKLQSPPNKLDKCYDTANELYESYLVITDLALNPTGSYSSFTKTSNDAISSFTSSYRKMDSQIPDKK
jgi:hypothetical protein